MTTHPAKRRLTLVTRGGGEAPRQAHNLKAAGSSPARATISRRGLLGALVAIAGAPFALRSAVFNEATAGSVEMWDLTEVLYERRHTDLRSRTGPPMVFFSELHDPLTCHPMLEIHALRSQVLDNRRTLRLKQRSRR